MNIFVAVIPKKPGLFLSFREALVKALPVTVPFYNDNPDLAIFTSGDILAASISIHASSCPIKSYVGDDEDSFCTFNGIPMINFSTEGSWGAALLHGLKSGDLKVEDIGGYYNIMYVDNSQVFAWNCTTRVEPVYWFENQDCITIGNRASLVWALGNRSCDFVYDEMSLITLATAGWLVNDSTPYKNVAVLPGGHNIVASSDGLKIIPYKKFTFQEIEDKDHEKYLVDNIYNQLIEGIQFFSGFSKKISVNLSGGKDSRILAGACDKAGINYSCITSGGALAPDMIIAKEVVQILNNPEHIISNRPVNDEIPRVDIFQRGTHHIKVGEGMLNLNDPTYGIRKIPRCLLTGHGGELLRGGYDRSIDRPKVSGIEAARKFLNDLTLHNSLFLLKEDAIHYQINANELIISDFMHSGFPFCNFYDWMYTVYREGRGIGNIRQASSYGAFSFSPFLNDNLLKYSWQLPFMFRKEEFLYYQLLQRINPLLAAHRFADSRWKFEINEPLPGDSYAGWMSRAPLPPGPPAHSAHHWRLAYDDYLRPVLKDYLLQITNSKIYSFIDIKKLEQVLNAPSPSSGTIIRSVLGIFTAAYLMDNKWKDHDEQH